MNITSKNNAKNTMKNVRPFAKMRAPSFEDVGWEGGFWAKRFETLKQNTLDEMWDAMNTPGNSVSFDNFYKQAGLKPGSFEGVDWGDGDCYKWMEAATRVLAVTKDATIDQKLDALISVIAKAQDPDGYINTQIQLTGKERWSRKRHHEDYNFGHLLTAASVHHRLTGKTNLLQVAVKAAEYLYELFMPKPRALVHFGWNPSNIMGLIDLYGETGDKRYIALADVFVSIRGSHPEDWSSIPDMIQIDPGDQNQDRVPLRDETTAVGHCVTAMYLYAGAADVYAETGEKALLDALMRIWDDVTSHKMYLNGGTAALYHGTSSRHDMVHEAFGLAYQLPNANAYNETCATIGNAMWNWRLLKITGEARFADIMERVVYNGMLSATNIDGNRYFYCNPLRYTGNPYNLNRDGELPNRWKVHTCFCCPPQVARSVGWMNEWVYGISEDAVWVHLYAASHLNTMLAEGSQIRLTQDTEYPWKGDIRVTVEEAPEKPIALYFRIPGWTAGLEDDTRIQVNGEDYKTDVRPGTYLEMKRQWKPGDTIDLSLPLQPRLVQANPLVEEARNQLAVQRGPVVYCMEEHDLPEGVRLDEVYLPAHTSFVPVYEENLLGGVVTLQAKMIRVLQPEWKNDLYRVVEKVDPQVIDAKFIPYYAWANRGDAQMSVFMPFYQGTNA
jgi:DUF1680 family protein